ncbi:MAG: hypothetical protein ACE5OR_03665 [bacterium]
MNGAERSYSLLRGFCLNEGIALFGVADVRKIRQTFRLPGIKEEFDYAISLGLRLSEAVLDEIEDGPTLLYAWHYRQANILLDRVAFRLSGLIQERGHRAIPIAASQLIDWRQQVGHLSHKHIGVLAGHGWIGRNNLLVHPEYGSEVRYRADRYGAAHRTPDGLRLRRLPRLYPRLPGSSPGRITRGLQLRSVFRTTEILSPQKKHRTSHLRHLCESVQGNIGPWERLNILRRQN